VYDCQDAEEFDAKAQGFHPRNARVCISNDSRGSTAPLPPAASPPLSGVGSDNSPVKLASPDSKSGGVPVLLTERVQPLRLTATLLLGNELGRCEVPEVLFRVRRYDLMVDECREQFMKELQLALQLSTTNLFRRFAGAWLDGVHGLLL
jgi:hypothetical protein